MLLLLSKTKAKYHHHSPPLSHGSHERVFQPRAFPLPENTRLLFISVFMDCNVLLLCLQLRWESKVLTLHGLTLCVST